MTDVVVETQPAPTVDVVVDESPTIDIDVTEFTVDAPIETATSIEVEIPGQKGDPGEPGGATITRTAGQNLSGHRLVTLDDNDQAVYADPTTVGQAQVLLTLNAALDGDNVELLAFGEHSEPSWMWTAGDVLYLGAAGVPTVTPPNGGFLVVVADAVNATTIFFNPRPPIALGA